MGIAAVFINAIVKAAIAKAADVLTRWRTESNGYSGQPDHVSKTLEASLAQTNSWSSEYQISGMSRPASVEADTVALTLASEPSSLTATGDISPRSESSLFADDKHYLILGPVGSGKTTTIKRLVRHLLSPPQSDSDTFQYPVVIRLRELPPNLSLFVAT